MSPTSSSSQTFHSSSSSTSALNVNSDLTYVSFPTSNTSPDYGESLNDCDDYSGTQGTGPSFHSTLSEPFPFDSNDAGSKPPLFLWKDSVFRLPLPRNRTGMILLDNYASTSTSSNPTVAQTTKAYIVTEDRPLHVSGHRKSILSGRGSGVYPVNEILPPELVNSITQKPQSIDKLVLKLAWPLKIGSLEPENQVLYDLLHSSPEIRINLPEIHFAGVYGLRDLKELEFSVPYPAIWLFQNSRRIVDRLVVLVMKRYEKLWDARSIEEFQSVFVDCVKCHHSAYAKGRYLHRDLSGNNLMIHRTNSASGSNEVKGILNDWDLAAKLDEHGNIPVSQRCFRTGTKPFLSLDLLQTSPPPHQYRHDLESFFWILVWAGLHFDLNGKQCGRKEVIRPWWDPQGSIEEARNAKMAFLSDIEVAQGVFDHFTSAFKDTEIKDRWIVPLYELLRSEYRIGIEGDHSDKLEAIWTFESFMSTVGSTVGGP